jgi:hypothetical protein
MPLGSHLAPFPLLIKLLSVLKSNEPTPNTCRVKGDLTKKETHCREKNDKKSCVFIVIEIAKYTKSGGGVASGEWRVAKGGGRRPEGRIPKAEISREKAQRTQKEP